jgi:DNA-binding transcriptional ArsR family regulator
VRNINEINDPRLVKALAHPLRVNILSALEHRVASPSELAEELGVPLPNLSYHIRMLVQLDLLKLVKTRPRRGAIEHYYQAKGPVVVSDKAWGEVPTLVKEVLVSSHLKQTGELVEDAAARGAFDSTEAHLTRHGFKLDAKAFSALSKRANELYEYARSLQKEAEKRRKESDHLDEVDAELVLMLFTTPSVEDAQPTTDRDSEGVHKRGSAGRKTTRRKAAR